ncbi:extracellular solute-binding protein [Deefgea sp. CFH1-16]|nr:extracellular solute-binding protein [Deefgea sp. CFH1-16]
MKFIRKIRLDFLTLALLSSMASAENTLRILTWHGYADPDWIAAFEQKYHSKVELTYVSSDDELWEKINRKQANNYDVFAVNTAELQRYIDHNLVTPIKQNQIPNSKNQLPRFRKTEQISGLNRNGHLYAIPFTYSEMGLIYDKKQFKTPPVSMNDLWQTRYSGKIVLYDGSNHNFSLAALTLHANNPFKLSANEMKQTVDKLLQLRPQNPIFYTTPEQGTQAFINNKAALMYANYGQQQVKLLQQAGADIGYIIPQEGVLAWLDCWAISNTSKNRKLAENWINYTLEKTVSHTLSQRQGLSNTLSGGNLKDSDKILWLEPSENFALRSQYWDRIRAGKARQDAQRQLTK